MESIIRKSVDSVPPDWDDVVDEQDCGEDYCQDAKSEDVEQQPNYYQRDQHGENSQRR